MRRLCEICLVCVLVAGLPVLAQDRPGFLHGTSVPAAQGQRTIVITADTRWVNVDYDEVIRFSLPNSEFGWKFDGPGQHPVSLQVIAPQGAVSSPVTVYVKRRHGRP